MRINVEYSTQHWIFPIITIGILVILGALLIALEGRARIKAGKGFFVKPGRFFVEHYDKFKFWGTIALMVVYFFLLDKLGFTFWSTHTPTFITATLRSDSVPFLLLFALWHIPSAWKCLYHCPGYRTGSPPGKSPGQALPHISGSRRSSVPYHKSETSVHSAQSLWNQVPKLPALYVSNTFG